MKVSPKRLNQAGFDHVMVVVGFVVLFALVGTWFLIHSLAATSSVYLHEATTGGPCIAGTTIQKCSGSSAQTFGQLSGSNFHIRNSSGQCIDDWNGKVGSNSSNRAYVQMASCYANDANQEWNWSNSRLVNAKSHGCLNAVGDSSAAGTALIVFTCNGQSNEVWKETFKSSSSGGGGSSGGSSKGAEFIARAERWQGLGYANLGSGYGEGGLVHSKGYYSFVKSCEGGHSGGTPHITGSTNSLCATDCSGFVSMVVDDVLHTSYVWIAGGEVMTGGGSGHWHLISASQARPGDIAVANDHVEFVRSGTGVNLTSYGEHDSYSHVSSAHMPTPFEVYRWE